MINTILGSKLKMSHLYEGTTRVPVTVVTAGPCVVTAIKHMDKDGYWAIQLGFSEKRSKNVTKPLLGHLKDTVKDNKAPRFLREVRVDEEPSLKVGDKVQLSDIFAVGDTIEVTGISKGKGFAGVVKRWNFAGGPKTHGQSDRLRAPGSIGQGTTPGRVLKGKHMAGRMGQDRKTIKNLRVINIDNTISQMAISGSLPGSVGGLLVIRRLSESKVVQPEAQTEGEANA